MRDEPNVKDFEIGQMRSEPMVTFVEPECYRLAKEFAGRVAISVSMDDTEVSLRLARVYATLALAEALTPPMRYITGPRT